MSGRRSSVEAIGSSTGPSLATTRARQGNPLVCVEVLGRSVVARLIDEFARAGFDAATQIERRSLDQAWEGADHQLRTYKDSGSDAVVVVRARAYIDLDLKDLLRFQRTAGRQKITRALDADEVPLDVRVVDPARIQEGADSPHRSRCGPSLPAILFAAT